MTPETMAAQCVEAINAGAGYVNFIKPAKMPKGFPRGEFLCQTEHFGKVYRYDATRVLAWMAANGLVKTSQAAT